MMSLDDKRTLARQWMLAQGITEVKALFKAKRRKRIAMRKKKSRK